MIINHTILRAYQWAALIRAHAELTTVALIVIAEAILKGGAAL